MTHSRLPGDGEPAGEPQGSLGCAKCGDCCERIKIGTHLTNVLAEMSNGGSRVRAGGSAREAAFLLRHWHPTGEVEREGDVVKQVLWCDRFDSVHRVCVAHDERPAVCSDYPFYGREPTVNMRELHCSYYLDLQPDQRPAGARPLIPLEVLRG